MADKLIVAADVHVRCRGKDYVIAHILDMYSVLAREVETGRPERLAISDLMPVPTGDAEVRRDVDVMGISDRDWGEANRRFEIIRPLITRGLRYRKEVEERAWGSGIHWTTLYRWIRDFQTTGKVSALVPRRSDGGRGKGRLSEDVETIIRETIDSHYLNDQQHDVAKTVQEILSRCHTAGITPPSESSIQRRIRRLSEEEAIARRRGRREAQQQFAPKTGSFPDADWPLAVGQMDHAKLDIVVVDEVERKPIGRPWITVLIDVWSRMVLGFYVSLDPPGTIGTALCVAHAVLPKEQWLAERGIDAVWPCWGFVRRIHVDNAKEFRGHTLKRACKEYEIDLEFRPVKKPRYGAHIERLMGTFGTELHALLGTTFSSPDERGEYDSEGRAVFTLAELEVWLATWITKVYHERLHRGIQRKPLARWEEGILGTKQRPGIGIPSRVVDETRLRIDFMPFFERTVQPGGIVIENVHYYDDKLRPYINARDPEDPKRKLFLRFHRDPRDISTVYFFDPASEQFVRIPYRDMSHPPISVWELREARRTILATGRKEIDEHSLFEAYENLRSMEEAAKRSTKKARRDAQRRRDHAAAPRPVLPPQTPAPVAVEGDLDTAPVTRPLQPFDEYDELEDRE